MSFFRDIFRFSACFSTTNEFTTVSTISLNLYTHKSDPLLHKLKCPLRLCVLGEDSSTVGIFTFFFFGERAMIFLVLWKWIQNNKTSLMFSSSGSKESKPTTGKLKSSNRPVTHCWDILEIMALVRLGPQIFTFLHSPGGTNEILWRASCLSLGWRWHWRALLHLYQSRVFCTATFFPPVMIAPAWITIVTICENLIPFHQHSTHPLLFSRSNHVCPTVTLLHNKGQEEEMNKRKRKKGLDGTCKLMQHRQLHV